MGSPKRVSPLSPALDAVSVRAADALDRLYHARRSRGNTARAAGIGHRRIGFRLLDSFPNLPDYSGSPYVGTERKSAGL